MQVKNIGTNLRRSIVIHGKRKCLTRYIGYPNIVEHLGVIKRDFAGDYYMTRMRGRGSESRRRCMKSHVRCITPREIARLCIDAFMLGT